MLRGFITVTHVGSTLFTQYCYNELSSVNLHYGYHLLQINSSSDAAQKQVEAHFTRLKNTMIAAVDKRLAQVQSEIESIREAALKPLDECKTLVDEGLKSAVHVMEEGINIISLKAFF